MDQPGVRVWQQNWSSGCHCVSGHNPVECPLGSSSRKRLSPVEEAPHRINPGRVQWCPSWPLSRMNLLHSGPHSIAKGLGTSSASIGYQLSQLWGRSPEPTRITLYRGAWGSRGPHISSFWGWQLKDQASAILLEPCQWSPVIAGPWHPLSVACG